MREKPPLPPKPLHLSAPSRSLLPSVSEHAPVVVKPARRSSSRQREIDRLILVQVEYSEWIEVVPETILSFTAKASFTYFLSVFESYAASTLPFIMLLSVIRLSSVKSSSVLHPNVTLRRKHTLMASASTAVLPSATVPSSSLSQTEPSETPKRIIGSSPLTRSMMVHALLFFTAICFSGDCHGTLNRQLILMARQHQGRYQG